MRTAQAAIALILLAPAPALGFEVALPLDCTVGADCVVQHYVDRDPGSEALDYECGHQTYDGHDGVDIRIPDLRAMAKGVAVLAAAPGTVAATRDGMNDVSIAETGVDAVRDVECGNGVLIDHADAWQTQYCHMKEGSIRVAKGDAVAVGAPLGEVGLSGMTEFPHVHFTVRKDGVEIDPFAIEPLSSGAACPTAGNTATGIWSKDAAASLAYRPAFVLNVGFADRKIEMDDIESGSLADIRITPRSPALVFYGRAIGIEKGDAQRLVVTGPDGSIFAESDVEPVERSKAQYMAFTGNKLRDERWPSGTYRGRYSVIRDGKEVASREEEIVIP